MNRNLLRILQSENGQILPWMALMITLVCGAAGLTIDLGHAYVCYRKLQSSTDAAALAGAYAMAQAGATQTSVKAQVSAFSSVTGGQNATLNLPAAAVSTVFNCVSPTSYPQYVSVDCIAFNTATTTAPNGDNIIQVTQTAKIPTYFIGALTMWAKNPETSLTMSATATAAMQSGPPIQVNVAMVVDTTASMGSNDNDPLCGHTRIYCALEGVQTLMQGLTPCEPGYTSSTCTGFDTVSLFTFPAVEASQKSYDTNCWETTLKLSPTQPLQRARRGPRYQERRLPTRSSVTPTTTVPRTGRAAHCPARPVRHLSQPHRTTVTAA